MDVSVLKKKRSRICFKKRSKNIVKNELIFEKNSNKTFNTLLSDLIKKTISFIEEKEGRKDAQAGEERPLEAEHQAPQTGSASTSQTESTSQSTQTELTSRAPQKDEQAKGALLNVGVDIGFRNLAISFEDVKISFCIRFKSKEEYYENLTSLFLGIKKIFEPRFEKIKFYVESQFQIINIKLEMYMRGVINAVFLTNSGKEADERGIDFCSIAMVPPSFKMKKSLKHGFEYEKLRNKKKFVDKVAVGGVFYDFLTSGWQFGLLDMDKRRTDFSSNIFSITPSFADYIDTRLLIIN